MMTSTVLGVVELDMLLELSLGLCGVDGVSVGVPGVVDTELVVGDGELED